jgi:hypothetical protein
LKEDKNSSVDTHSKTKIGYPGSLIGSGKRLHKRKKPSETKYLGLDVEGNVKDRLFSTNEALGKCWWLWGESCKGMIKTGDLKNRGKKQGSVGENRIEFQRGNLRVRVYDRLLFLILFLQFLFFVFDEKSCGNEKNLDSAGNLCNRSGRDQVRVPSRRKIG